MSTPFEKAAKRAIQFTASLHTLQELVESIDDYIFAKEMCDKTMKIPDLRPSVNSFLEEIRDINSFHQKCADIFENNLGISA
jgi:hypothetical protein